LAAAIGLEPFGPCAQMTGLLHDFIEGPARTAERLWVVGVPGMVVGIVVAVTSVTGAPPMPR
jgi:hypothetical protein